MCMFKPKHLFHYDETTGMGTVSLIQHDLYVDNLRSWEIEQMEFDKGELDKYHDQQPPAYCPVDNDQAPPPRYQLQQQHGSHHYMDHKNNKCLPLPVTTPRRKLTRFSRLRTHMFIITLCLVLLGLHTMASHCG
ncbi:unnamed protein product [Cyberlindnera jadinii]|uniref:Uncharacterized protein n=1 Tax=Cyberlindnera jadinii (strain ATCC 18201 / CBS 1600 / BCRC 20928 / JCM 3617 / NBRC 0987 / NRRL Y-1542) TaxID=983966 RepID=A0A0H5C8J7_CYBJN|nr:hypothetical protein CYBJADRAFT_167915 [Cyberlindnera jadinii NRRL Y-1542]ODV73339.1 hypothetical protein CYBJADRAFT_167915 [Cyberlindnera jadinii NRRL Y-1542]CEP24538.1 unnamed protein product [Cyberlindnera jadinii]